MRAGIYIIENLKNGKFYIGSAVNIKRRLKDHRVRLNSQTHGNPHLQRAWNKYGSNAFKFKGLLSCGTENLILWEQIAIDYYCKVIGWDMLYNQSRTAGSGLGTKRSKETRAKMSAAQMGKRPSRASKDKNAIAHRGIKASSETRAKMSKSQKQRWKNNPCSDELRAKQSAMRKEYWRKRHEQE